MRNHSLFGRYLGESIGLSFLLPVGLLALAGCQGSTTNSDPNYHPVDSRRSAGNPLVGALCDDRHTCANNSTGTATPCVTANLYDTVGFCAPACATDSDCDTGLSGLAKCTNMGSSPECVLFCDQNHVNTSKDCPDTWTCQLVSGQQQSFYMCVPPQTRLPTTDGGT